MTTHELAQLLLSQPNEKLYSESLWDTDYSCDNSDDGFAYSEIVGIDFNRLEKGAVLKTGEYDNTVNNKKYKVGDVFFVLDQLFYIYDDESEAKVNKLLQTPLKDFKKEDLHLLKNFNIVDLLSGQPRYSYDFEMISFFNEYSGDQPKEIDTSDVDTFLHDRILVVMEEGFHPKMQEMTCKEAYDWFLLNHPERFNNE